MLSSIILSTSIVTYLLNLALLLLNILRSISLRLAFGLYIGFLAIWLSLYSLNTLYTIIPISLKVVPLKALLVEVTP